MLLKSIISKLNHNDLKNFAKFYLVESFSKLKKEELVDAIVNKVSSEAYLRSCLSFFCDGEIKLLADGCDKAAAVTRKNIAMATVLGENIYGKIDLVAGTFTTYEEIAGTLKIINDESLEASRAKKSPVARYAKFAAEYYGVAPIEAIYDMYSKKHDKSIREMAEIIMDIPVQAAFGHYIGKEELAEIVGKDVSLPQTEYGYYINDALEEDPKMLAKMLEIQGDRDFYVPNERQLDDILYIGYEVNAASYKKAAEFFEPLASEFDLLPATILNMMWQHFVLGDDPDEIVEMLVCNEFENIPEEYEAAMSMFMEKLVYDAYADTRLTELRGYTPEELGLVELIDGKTRDSNIISFDAAHGKTGAQKKIRPNDPCPCGSGKKYKACCGRGK